MATTMLARMLVALWRRWALPAAVAILALAFLVAVLAQRQPHWYPVLDLAMTELRVRDVFTGRTPLVGLPGRIGDFPDQGSHPGPLSFYALAPFYRVFGLVGTSTWALQAAAAAVNLIACALALWIARLRGGATMVAAVLLMLAVLLRGYGMESLVEPWNPLMPLLWWVVLLLAVWSVLCGDVRLLPVAVVAGSFCAQTHVPYLLLAVGVGAAGAVGAVLAWRAAPKEDGGGAAASSASGIGSGARQGARQPKGWIVRTRRDVVRWIVLAAALGVVLWLPPIVDQLRGEGGNISMLVEHFAADPPEAKIGIVDGADWLLVNLNPWYFVARGDGFVGGPLVSAALDPTRSPVPGALLVLAWVAAAAIALRRRHRPLLSMHAVIGTGLVLGTLSLANVFGKQWYYLTLWTWSLAALMVGSILWSVLLLVRDRLPPEQASRLAGGAGVVMVALALVATGFAAAASVDDDPPDPMLSAVLGEVVPPTVGAIDDEVGAAGGPDGRYLVTWSDAYYIGDQGYGLALELERRGYDVGVVDTFRVPMTPHRVLDPDDATAEIHLATGARIADAAARPGAVEVVRVDPRSPAQREEFDRLRREVVAELQELGLDDLVAAVDDNLFSVPIDPRLPFPLERKAFRLLELGQPTAVFVLPPPSAAS